jgi:hypothetical protein
MGLYGGDYMKFYVVEREPGAETVKYTAIEMTDTEYTELFNDLNSFQYTHDEEHYWNGKDFVEYTMYSNVAYHPIIVEKTRNAEWKEVNINEV